MQDCYKAMVFNTPNEDFTLEQFKIPTPKPNYSGIRLDYSSLNHRDLWIFMGNYPNVKTPIILGSDGAGQIVKTGENSKIELDKNVIINPGLNWGSDSRRQSSDFEILGNPSSGTFSQYVEIPNSQLFELPSHLSLMEGASLPLAGLTAYRCLFSQGKLQKNQKVLITGIGGGVALFALQFSIAIQSKVYVTSSDENKINIAKQLGAQSGELYTDSDWSKKLGFNSFDLIIDGSAGADFNELLNLCKPGGIIVNYGATGGNPDFIGMRTLFSKQIQIIGSMMGSQEDFINMLKLVSKYEIHPVIDSQFKLSELIQGIYKMKNRQQFGKIVFLNSDIK